MITWERVTGSQTEKPAEYDSTSSGVYVYQRRNIARVSSVDEMSGKTVESWEYDERKIPKNEFFNIQLQDLMSTISDIEDALCDMDASE